MSKELKALLDAWELLYRKWLELRGCDPPAPGFVQDIIAHAAQKLEAEMKEMVKGESNEQ